MTDELDKPEESDDDADLASAMRTCIMRLARQLRVERSDESLSFSQHSALAVIESRGPIFLEISPRSNASSHPR